MAAMIPFSCRCHIVEPTAAMAEDRANSHHQLWHGLMGLQYSDLQCRRFGERVKEGQGVAAS
jgi:hypothetical protein